MQARFSLSERLSEKDADAGEQAEDRSENAGEGGSERTEDHGITSIVVCTGRAPEGARDADQIRARRRGYVHFRPISRARDVYRYLSSASVIQRTCCNIMSVSPANARFMSFEPFLVR